MSKRASRVMAIHPGHGGFGFVVLEGPERIADWGIKSYRSDEEAYVLRQLERLVGQYHPDALLLPRRTPHQSPRIRLLNNWISAWARRFTVDMHMISRRSIDAAFSRHGRMNQERALAVVQKLPQLSRWFPRKRRIWGGEDHRMKIFQAAMLALAFYNGDSTI